MDERRNVYSRAPARTVDGIPVFFEENDFTRNYDAIYREVFEQIAAGRDPNEEGIFREMEDADLRLIADHSSGGRIVDCGVAMGRILSRLPDSYEKHGFDINLPCLREARRRGIEVCCALVEDLPYHDGAFDLALASDFLEHVLDLHAALRSILRVLRPGGLLFVRTPWREDLGKYVRDDFPHRYHHLRSFDEPFFRLLLERVFGCTVLEHRLVGWAVTPETRKTRLPFAGRIARGSRLFGEGVHRRLLRRFFRAHEIEVVARKG